MIQTTDVLARARARVSREQITSAKSDDINVGIHMSVWTTEVDSIGSEIMTAAMALGLGYDQCVEILAGLGLGVYPGGMYGRRGDVDATWARMPWSQVREDDRYYCYPIARSWGRRFGQGEKQ